MNTLAVFLLLMAEAAAPFSIKRSERVELQSAPGVLAAADLNGDGKADLIVANPDEGTVAVLLGDGKGRFAPAKGSPFAAGKNPNDIAIADINRDGKLDLAIANHEATFVTILLGDGRGGFAPSPKSPVTVKSFPHPHAVALGDVNGDNKIELIVDDWGRGNVTLLFGDGSGGFASPGTSISVPPVPYENLRLADVNGDGKLDIVVPARMGMAGAAGPPAVREGMTVLLGDARGGFSAAPGSPFKSGKAPTRVVVGDVNGDGIDDAVVLNLASNNVTVLLGGRNGISLAPGSPFRAGSSPQGAAIADVNGDGKREIIIANHDSRDLTILFAE